MASLGLSISFETKRSHFSGNPLQFSDRCSISSYMSSKRACIFTCISKFSHLKENPNSHFEIGKINRVRKKVTSREQGHKFNLKTNQGRSERERDEVFVLDSEFDVNYSVIRPDLGMVECNEILKKLEKGSDRKTLQFFEWMKSNGKLENNVSAYNLVLRVLGRKEDWDEAEKMVRELSAELGSNLSFQVFNTIIYACCKKGYVDLVTKWFKLMIELKVEPNVATYGMVMGVYRKGWKIEEAEFVFTRMRSSGVICESAYSAMITIYTRMRLYEKAEEVIFFMTEDKVVKNLENWLVLLNAYSQQGKLEEAEQVLVLMKEFGFSGNIVAYNTLITGYGKVSNMDAAQRMFESLKLNGFQPDETTYRSMIEGWGRVGNYKEAKWYYNELKQLGHKPNSSNLYTLINLQARNGDENGAIEILHEMLKTGCQYSSILSTILQAYERAGKIKQVPLILNRTFYQNILVNQTACFIVVTAYVKHGLVDDAITVLKDKTWEDRNFEDNLYHLIICSCKDMGHFENAVKIYAQMINSADKPNLQVSCTMIDVYSIMGNFGEAEKVYQNLKFYGVSLDMVGYSIVVRMYVKSGSLNEACSVLEIMEEQKDIFPDVYLFRDMLRIYQRCGMVDKLAQLYFKILKSGVVMDEEMYNCLINCCARALPVDELSKRFDEMIRHGFAPNTITFNVMLDVYGKSNLFSKARELFVMAEKQGWVDVISHNTIIAAYKQHKDFKNMSSAIRKMQHDGFSLSLEVYNCMLDAYGKHGQMEKFITVLQKMKESKCDADNYTYNIMINIFGEQGWFDEILDLLKELEVSGRKPDLCGYNTLIKAYGIAGMVEDAVGLMKEMRENGIKPDKITYNNLITSLQKNDEFLEAVRWSLWMKQIGL